MPLLAPHHLIITALTALTALPLARASSPPTSAYPPLASEHATSVATAAAADLASLTTSDCFSEVVRALASSSSSSPFPSSPSSSASSATTTPPPPCARLTHARQVRLALAFLACQAEFLGETDLPACAGKAKERLDVEEEAEEPDALRPCVASLPARHYDSFQGFFRSASATCLHYAHRAWAAHAGALLEQLLASGSVAAAALDGLQAGLAGAAAGLAELRASAADAATAAGQVAARLEARGAEAVAAATAAAAAAALAVERNAMATAAVDELAAAARRRAAASAEAAWAADKASAAAADALAARLAAIDAKTAGLASTIDTFTHYQVSADALLRRVLGKGGRGAGRAFYGAAALAAAAIAATPRTRAAALPLVAGMAWLLALERGAAAVVPSLTVATAVRGGPWGGRGGAGGAWWGPALQAAEAAASALAAGAGRPFAALVGVFLISWAWATWIDPLTAARAALEGEVAGLRALVVSGVATRNEEPRGEQPAATARRAPPARQAAPVTPVSRALRPRPGRRPGG